LAGMLDADLLCLLSTVPGVYDRDPDQADAACIPHWNEQQHQAEEIVQRGTSALGRGGMHSKIAMARKAAKLGTEAVIADGRDGDILRKVVNGIEAGTRFAAQGETSPTKRWLASAQTASAGSVVINPGAQAALLDDNLLTSLLPVGIEQVDGPFERGDVIQIRSVNGQVLGCGRAQYDHAEADRIKGERGHRPLIHYDYLYLETREQQTRPVRQTGSKLK